MTARDNNLSGQGAAVFEEEPVNGCNNGSEQYIDRQESRKDEGGYFFNNPSLDEISEDYRTWNALLAKRLLLDEGSENLSFLSMTPGILSSLGSEILGRPADAAEAEKYFCRAVGDMYRRYVLGQREKLRVLHRIGSDGLPECIGFLGLSVLAAYHMHSDEEAAGYAYYIRLANLLDCGLTGTYPDGFDARVFESLWRFVGDWLQKRCGRILALPGVNVGFRRFVAIPLAHVPLRRVDVERLPAFFDWAGYEPGSRVSFDSLIRDLSRWNAVSLFTPAGATALTDDRQQGVLAQIAGELMSWDGEVSDTGLRRRSAVVELILDPRRGRPNIYYLPRRPPGFPVRFNDGTHIFDSSDQGWYEPVQATREDGPLLVNGFEWETVVDGVRIVLRRAPKNVIAFTPSDAYSGFLSHRSLIAGVNCAVLCRHELAVAAVDYLRDVSEKEVKAIRHPNLPEGWELFTNVSPKRYLEPPNGLDAIEVDSAINLVPVGGLRVGRRWQWLAGAPPKLIVSGLFEEQVVTVDGVAVSVDDGVLSAAEQLNVPGIHLVRAGRMEKSIEIMEPTIGNVEDVYHDGGPDRYSVGLVRGNWILIGGTPGEVFFAGRGNLNGVFAASPFEPAWAVEVGAGPGARVHCLSSNPQVPRALSRAQMHGREGDQLERWATTIYSAAVRHPLFSSFTPLNKALIQDSWRSYVNAAKHIKRSLGRRKR